MDYEPLYHYTMLCKYGKKTRDFWDVFILSLV